MVGAGRTVRRARVNTRSHPRGDLLLISKPATPGYNGDGELGLDDTDSRGDGPDEMGDQLPGVFLGLTASAISCGRDHTCALLSDGQMKCWGAFLFFLSFLRCLRCQCGSDAYWIGFTLFVRR
jgi:hypothetical protein